MLTFREDGTFTIVQFTDIHWKDGGTNDLRTQSFMREALAAEKPDLIVVTGDVIDKQDCPDPLPSFKQALDPICESGIPWAFAFGNHEHECGVDPRMFGSLLRRLPNSLYDSGPGDVRGFSNFVLPIRGSRSPGAAAAVYVLDSGAKTAMPFGGTEWIDATQIAWYRREAGRLRAQNGGKPLPALAFFHIPLPEYKEVWASRVCYGTKHKKTDSPKVNSGFFAAMVETGDVMGTFVGHCHLNDYYGDLYGVRLCYSRLSGVGAKGPADYERGARVVRLREGQRTFDVWQRLEGGAVLDDPPEHLPGETDGL